jgi:hypothetical protein
LVLSIVGYSALQQFVVPHCLDFQLLYWRSLFLLQL